MKKSFVVAALVACMAAAAPSVQAGEPNLSALGLSSMTKMTHSEAKNVRGQTRRNRASVSGSTIHGSAGAVFLGGGGQVGNGIIIGGGGIGYLSGATSSYSATGGKSATGTSFSQGSPFSAFTTSTSSAR